VKLIKELAAFFLSVAKNNFTVEFFSVFIPIVIVWETLPRLGVVPSSLLPPPTVIAATFKDLILNHDLLGHAWISMLSILITRSITCKTVNIEVKEAGYDGTKTIWQRPWARQRVYYAPGAERRAL